MVGKVSPRAGVESHIVRVGVPDIVWAESFRSSFALSPVNLPGNHVMFAWVVHPTVGAHAKVGAVELVQDSSPHRHKIPAG